MQTFEVRIREFANGLGPAPEVRTETIQAGHFLIVDRILTFYSDEEEAIAAYTNWDKVIVKVPG